MATMEKKSHEIEKEYVDYPIKEWNAHKEGMMTYVGMILDQEMVIYDGLSEIWDLHGKELRSQVSSSVRDGNRSCKVLHHHINGFTNTINQQQLKAASKRKRGRIKVLQDFQNVIDRTDVLIKDFEMDLRLIDEGSLSQEHYSSWKKASNDLTQQFTKILETGKGQYYPLAGLWDDFHVTGQQIVSSIPNGVYKKKIAPAWISMADLMNAEISLMIIDGRDQLEAIQRERDRSEERLQRKLSNIF